MIHSLIEGIITGLTILLVVITVFLFGLGGFFIIKELIDIIRETINRSKQNK
jgi:hypothetical protein